MTGTRCAGRRWVIRVGCVAAVVLSTSWLTACSNVEPLATPVPADRRVTGGLDIVLTNADLGYLAQAVRHTVGGTVAVSLAPGPVAGTTKSLAATTLHATITQAAAKLATAGSIVFQHGFEAAGLSLSLTAPGQPACVVTTTSLEGHIAVTLRFARNSGEIAEVVLAEQPALVAQGGVLEDAGGCLADAAPGAAAALAQHVRDALKAAMINRFVPAGRDVLTAVLPPSLEIAMQAGALRVQSAFVDAAGSRGVGSLLDHNGQFARASLSIAADIDRHACAVDQPPPALAVTPLGLLTPAPPEGTWLLRRAVAIDRSLLAHVAWLVHRSGLLCASRPLTGETELSAQWAADVAPALAMWVKGPPSRVRFWPGNLGEAEWINGHTGAGASIPLPEAVLEIVAPIGGIDVVVLRIQGTFRMEVTLQTATPGLTFAVTGASVESAAVRSPIFSDTLTVNETGLNTLVRDFVVSALGGAIPAVSVPGFEKASVVSAARVGERLWIWLEEAPPTGG